jgi:hypothetical protein
MELTEEQKKAILSEHMREIGGRGGQATKKKHGKKHFRAIRKLVGVDKSKKPRKV